MRTGKFDAVDGMHAEQVREALRLAALAPSTHNTQPWRFRLAGGRFEVWADLDRRLPVTDADDRELRLACGAAVFNLRLAVHQVGRQPDTRLLPDPARPELIATVRAAGSAAPTPSLTALAAAIPARRTNRRPFLPQPVPTALRHELVRATEREAAHLVIVEDQAQRHSLRALVRAAHQAQQADPAFRAELDSWTGHDGTRTDGVPAALGGPRPEPQDQWVLRDFTRGAARERVTGKDFEPDPLIAVLCSYSDDPIDQLRAGQAMQRLLLTATNHGLSASFLAQPVERPVQRGELRRLLADSWWPQTVLRIGYGTPTPSSPRRNVDGLLAP